jgi:transposase
MQELSKIRESTKRLLRISTSVAAGVRLQPRQGRWGGVASSLAVAEAKGISDRTIRNGILELDDTEQLGVDRQRRPGAGRPSRENQHPELIEALESLVAASTRGDPMTPIRWVCHSTRDLARELQRQGFQVSSTKVGQLLRSQGFSLQANRKTVEGKQHPDRDAQFQHIAARVKAFQRTGQPAVSVDTKKKEPLGNMKNPGKRYRKKRDPQPVTTHDFPDKELTWQGRPLRRLRHDAERSRCHRGYQP